MTRAQSLIQELKKELFPTDTAKNMLAAMDTDDRALVMLLVQLEAIINTDSQAPWFTQEKQRRQRVGAR